MGESPLIIELIARPISGFPPVNAKYKVRLSDYEFLPWDDTVRFGLAIHELALRPTQYTNNFFTWLCLLY